MSFSTTAPVSPDDVGGQAPNGLQPETQQSVVGLAKKPGNHSVVVAEVARNNATIKQHERLSAARRQESACKAQRSEYAEQFRENASQLKETERLLTIPGEPPGLLGGFVALVMLAVSGGLVWIENGAAAQTLLATGAFDITTLSRAREMMAIPVGVGFALAFAYWIVPARLRRKMVLTAVCLLPIVFSVWAASFALEASRYSAAAQDKLFFAMDLDVNLPEPDTPNQSTWPSIAMFGCIVLLMPITAFLGHGGIDAIVHKNDVHRPNPDYQALLEERQMHRDTIAEIDRRLSDIDEEIRACEMAIENEVSTARAFYLSQKIPALLILICLMLTGCMSESNSGPAATGLHGWAEAEASSEDEPVTKVLAVSPRLPRTAKQELFSQLETELKWLSEDAPVGSITVVVDGLGCKPVARLEAVQGVSRIRKKVLARSMPKLREFFNERSRGDQNGQLHLPRLAQTAAQWRLPAGSHVLVYGNPLFVDDGRDEFFSMVDGLVPTDGALFESPDFNLYSIVGRERALQDQRWHLAWEDGSVFHDDSHRQAVLRFWSLYFQEQGAVLVTAQGSLMAAAEAIRDRSADPFINAVADLKTEASMRKMIRIETPPELIELDTKEEVDCRDGKCPDRQTVAKPAIEEATNEVKTEVVEDTVDQHGNLIGSDKDLVADRELSGSRMLLLNLCISQNVDTSRLVTALETKGLDVDTMTYPLPPAVQFGERLREYQQVWVWSGDQSSRLSQDHVRQLMLWWRQDQRGLCILADNSPYVMEANRVLKGIFPEAYITGNNPGQQFLKPRNSNAAGFDPSHPLFHNIETLYEGYSVSSVKGGGLEPVCRASDGQPLISVYESDGSRMLVHCGFTSFLPEFWDDAGISRFAMNCGGWLAGKDGSGNASN